MMTRCSACGKTLPDDENKTFLLCIHCNKFTPRGADSYRKPLKGGDNRMTSKKEVSASTTKKKAVKKVVTKEIKKKTVSKEKVFNPEKYLRCGKCKAIKRAGPKRIVKWKDKPYLCRECRYTKKK